MRTARTILAVIFAIPAVVLGLYTIWYLLEWLAFGLGYRLGTAFVAGTLCLLFVTAAQLLRPEPA